MSKSSRVAVNFQMKLVETLSGSFCEETLRFLVPIFTQLKRIDSLRFLESTLQGSSLNFFPAILNEILQCKHLTHLIVQTGRMDNEVGVVNIVVVSVYNLSFLLGLDRNW